MSTIDSGYSINDPNVKAVHLNQNDIRHISEAPEELYQSYVYSEERILKALHTQLDTAPNSPRNQDYASVEVGGQVVATVSNNGFVTSSNAAAGSFHELFINENTGLIGPALAQDRAAKIAELLGGKVAQSSTAINQSQFNATAAPQAYIDYKAMLQDPRFEQLQKAKEARTLYLAQENGLSANGTNQKVILDTNHGKEEIDLDEYFSPNRGKGPINLNDVTMVFPTAQNINTLTKHAETKLQELLKAYDIPQGPQSISYDQTGSIQLPHDYPYKDELKQALDENPDMARELNTLAGITSHYVGMQAAFKGTNTGSNYAKITLDFNDERELRVSANGKPYGGGDNTQAQQASASYAQSNSSQEEDVSSSSSAEDWFRDYLIKTPEERLYEALLKKKGLTPEELAALPPEEKLAIEQEIQEEMRKRVINKMGSPVGSTESKVA